MEKITPTNFGMGNTKMKQKNKNKTNTHTFSYERASMKIVGSRSRLNIAGKKEKER